MYDVEDVKKEKKNKKEKNKRQLRNYIVETRSIEKRTEMSSSWFTAIHTRFLLLNITIILLIKYPRRKKRDIKRHTLNSGNSNLFQIGKGNR